MGYVAAVGCAFTAGLVAGMAAMYIAMRRDEE